MEYEIAEIAKLKESGLTYQEIADDIGLTRQRVGQLLNPSREIRELLFSRSDMKCQMCGISLIKSSFNLHHKSYEPLTIDDKDNYLILCNSCHRKMHPNKQKERNEPIDIKYKGWLISPDNCQDDSDETYYHITLGYKSLDVIKKQIDRILESDLIPDCWITE